MINKIRICIAFLLLFTIVKTNGQVSSTDSLKIISCANNAQSFLQTNVDSSLFYANYGYKLAKETKNNFLQCRATIMLAIVNQNLSEYKKATAYFKEGIALAEKGNNKQLLAQGYNGFANMFALQKQFTQASEYFNKALEICKEIKDTSKVAVMLMNLANIEYTASYESNDYTKTNQSYKEAYEWAVLAKDTGQQISCLGNWGLSYSDESKFNLSLEKLNIAIELAKSINYTADLIYLKHYLGRTYGYMKEHQKAIDAFTESLKLAVQFKDINYQSEDYACIANTYYEMGNYKDAYSVF